MDLEEIEVTLHNLTIKLPGSLPDDMRIREQIMEIEHKTLGAKELLRQHISELLNQLGEDIPQEKGQEDAVSD